MTANAHMTVTCERCSTVFRVKPARLKRGVRFCSQACRSDFWRHVDIRGPDECWPWTGSTMRHSGHGHVRIDGKLRPAHHVAFKLKHGRWPIPALRHTCDNPPCCNDAHLIEGTQAENMADKVARGRQQRGPSLSAAVRMGKAKARRL